MLQLPFYHATADEKRSVEGKKRTSRLIRTLWKAADVTRRRDANFLCLLMQCGWNTDVHDTKPTTKWRNTHLARYLGVRYTSDSQLVSDLCKRIPRLSAKAAAMLLKTKTGVTHYPNFYHKAALRFVRDNHEIIGQAFRKTSRVEHPAENKVFAVASIIEDLGRMKSSAKRPSPFNALTPALACLDPQRRFPIMNQKTGRLLKQFPEEPNAKGMRELVRLIGSNGIRNSFELDAYALYEKFPKPPRRRASRPIAEPTTKVLSIKSEMDSIARISAKRVTITKRHNALTNRFRDVLRWKHRIEPKESRFDALIEDWKKGRDLLVEAKTASEGSLGRTQIRQAIGQLIDYRFTYFHGNKVDLAVLLAKQPGKDVQELLGSQSIECLWFEGKKLAGTIRLIPKFE